MAASQASHEIGAVPGSESFSPTPAGVRRSLGIARIGDFLANTPAASGAGGVRALQQHRRFW